VNPFDLVFNALWTLAEQSDALTSLVKTGNRIKFNTSNRDPIKPVVADADVPELILSSEGSSTLNLHSSSCGSMIVKRYTWLLSTGDMRINHHLNPVTWALLCAMADWQSVLGPLQWEDELFCKRFNLIDTSEGQSDPERNRGLRGWSALWRCEVEMHFTTSKLIAFNAGS